MTKSQWIKLKASDGVEISAYEALPDGDVPSTLATIVIFPAPCS